MMRVLTERGYCIADDGKPDPKEEFRRRLVNGALKDYHREAIELGLDPAEVDAIAIAVTLESNRGILTVRWKGKEGRYV